MVLCCHLSLVRSDIALGTAWTNGGGGGGQAGTLLPPTGIHYMQCPARPDLKLTL